jgi:uncharacterized membrane protein
MRTRRNNGDSNRLYLLGVAGIAALAGAAWAMTRSAPARRPDKRRPDMPTLAGGRGCRVERTVTVMRSADELYERWRDLSRLPDLMPHIEKVTPLEGGRSRWVARGPAGVRFAWDAELIADKPGQLIAWRSVERADIDNAGSVRFTPVAGGRGTEVKVLLSYAPPAGRAGCAAATVLGRGADTEVREDLRRFKQRMETNEVPTSASRREHAAAGAKESR